MIESAAADQMARTALAAHVAGELDARATLAALDHALEIEPDLALAHRARGMLLHREKRLGEAVASLRRAQALDANAAPTLLALANVLHDQGDVAGCRRALESLLAAEPHHGEAHIILGSLLGADPKTADAALDHLRAATRLGPDSAWAHETLGAFLDGYNQPEAAEASLRKAVELKPGQASAWGALAVCLVRTGRFTEAEAAARQAVALSPDQAAAHVALASAGLARGDLAQAWPAYEHRLKLQRSQSPAKATRLPRWRGEPLAKKSILVWREEGLGDELRYATCLPDLIAVAGRVVWETSPRLAPLYARSFPTIEVRPFSIADETAADYHVPVGSLPLHARKTLQDFPKHPAPLQADPVRVEAARQWLRRLGTGPAIGVSWRSRNTGTAKQAFSSSLSEWASVFRIPGARFVCLQYGNVDAEVAAAEAEHGIRMHRLPGLDLTNDLDGVAALMTTLDVVVTARTTVAALAGAMGRPTNVFVTEPNEWALGQAVDPWFPSNLLYYRAATPGWTDTLDRIAADLRQEVLACR